MFWISFINTINSSLNNTYTSLESLNVVDTQPNEWTVQNSVHIFDVSFFSLSIEETVILQTNNERCELT